MDIKSFVSKTASASTTTLDSSIPPVRDQLSWIQESLHAQKVDENLKTDVTVFLHQLNEVKDVKSCNLPALVPLRDHVTKLATLQEIQIAENLKIICTEMERLDLSLVTEDKENMLMFLTAPQLTNVSQHIEILAKLKKGRKSYTKENIDSVMYVTLIEMVEEACRAEDFHSCKVLLARMKDMMKITKLT